MKNDIRTDYDSRNLQKTRFVLSTNDEKGECVVRSEYNGVKTANPRQNTAHPRESQQFRESVCQSIS